jgi:transaldolase
VTLISPFVGRIFDWQKAKEGRSEIPAEEDMGVLSVRRIYEYFKSYGYPTTVMGASFRNMAEIVALAGCDRLTISPALLDELHQTEGVLERRLRVVGEIKPKPNTMSEAEFRWEMNQDAMATEKLAEGIGGFTIDQIKLEKMLAERMAA